MTANDHLLLLVEGLAIPLDDPSSPNDWKEWYHYILFDYHTGTRILANVSLTGRPGDGEITITVLATMPTEGGAGRCSELMETYGFTTDFEWDHGMVHRVPVEVDVGAARYTIIGTDFSLYTRSADDGITFDLRGTTRATPLFVPEATPFAGGFIAWGLVPGADVAGELLLGDRRIVVSNDWYCYHDHNYGRFRWGDDVGWIWLTATARDSDGRELAYVFHRGNNRDQTRIGTPYLFVYEGRDLRKVFLGPAVTIAVEWGSELVQPMRLPGTMASLFADQRSLMPVRLVIDAADERDRCHIEMPIDATMEFVLPDNRYRQYTTIKELSGPLHLHGMVDGTIHTGEGMFYAEYVR